jgi:hypothetical protein
MGQVLLKSDKNNRYFTWGPMYVYGNISLYSSYNQKFFGQKFEDRIKTHILYSTDFSENRDFYEIMWKNKVQRYGPQITKNMTQERCDLHAG